MSTITTTPAIRINELSKTYGTADNAVHALTAVTAQFERGSFTAIMGPSGSGKSTLLQCAAGLDTPSSGDVFIGEMSIGKLSPAQLTQLRRDHVGFVFQSFNLIQSLSVGQNIALPLWLGRKSPRQQEIIAALQQVDLADKIDQLPSQLSGGQQQRVAIARALVVQPDILFADEPTGALDIRASKDFLALVRSVAAERGLTVIMVTHDPMAAASADRVLFLADGKLAGSLAKPTPTAIVNRMNELER